MMRAKADPKATTNLIWFAACVLLGGSLLGLVFPKPDPTLPTRKEKTGEKKIHADMKKSEADTVAANATVARYTWTGEVSTIQNQALSMISEMAKRRKVTLVRFQPQRNAATSEVLEQLQFLLVVEGPFPAIAALERDIENPTNRLAVNLFQVGSSDSETNAVSANIGVVAHRLPPVVEEKKETKSVKKRP